MRALVFTNLYPSAQSPARGSFVRDQAAELERLPGVELELFTFGLGGPSAYLHAGHEARRRYRGVRFDVVHAHFGLCAWPALAVPAAAHAVTLHGTDVVHPRSRQITLAALPFLDLIAPVSSQLAALLPERAVAGKLAVLPCGVNTQRFKPIPRAQARRALGLNPKGAYVLFPADPARREKRYDRALALAGEVPVLSVGTVDPDEMPLWINAANAVLVPSERESFGLAILEALACDVPVLATPVGVAPEVLSDVPGTHCGPFDEAAWSAELASALAQPDPRVPGRAVAERYSAERMATRVLAQWQSTLWGG